MSFVMRGTSTGEPEAGTVLTRFANTPPTRAHARIVRLTSSTAAAAHARRLRQMTCQVSPKRSSNATKPTKREFPKKAVAAASTASTSAKKRRPQDNTFFAFLGALANSSSVWLQGNAGFESGSAWWWWSQPPNGQGSEATTWCRSSSLALASSPIHSSGVTGLAEPASCGYGHSFGYAWCIHWANSRPWMFTSPPCKLATSCKRLSKGSDK
mmetsp:Transcript_118345/g.295308  ORF Transcript_118345/g.295308 Transcript_118345/m.295308 type:complete len:212 (+) Transcript_118345:96-731(+)